MRFGRRRKEWDARRPTPCIPDSELAGTCAFYKKLRSTWERGVEERVLADVMMRPQRAVKTQSLRDVKVSAEIIALLKEGMDRCALFVHDDPAAAPVSLPDRARVEADVELLNKFAELTK